MNAVHQHVVCLNGHGHHQPAGSVRLHFPPMNQRKVLPAEHPVGTRYLGERNPRQTAKHGNVRTVAGIDACRLRLGLPDQRQGVIQKRGQPVTVLHQNLRKFPVRRQYGNQGIHGIILPHVSVLHPLPQLRHAVQSLQQNKQAQGEKRNPLLFPITVQGIHPDGRCNGKHGAVKRLEIFVMRPARPRGQFNFLLHHRLEAGLFHTC